jgi:hypothetical protein
LAADQLLQARAPASPSPNGFDVNIESVFLAWLCGGNPAVFIAVEAAENLVRTHVAAQWRDESSIAYRRHTKFIGLLRGAKQVLSFAESEKVPRRTLHGLYFAMLLEATIVLESLTRRQIAFIDFTDGLKQMESLEAKEYIYCRRAVTFREEAERAQRILDDREHRLQRIAFDEAQALQRAQFERYHSSENEEVREAEARAWRELELTGEREFRTARLAQLDYEERCRTLEKTRENCDALFYPERNVRSSIMAEEDAAFQGFHSREVSSYLATRRNHLINNDVAAQMRAMDSRHGLLKRESIGEGGGRSRLIFFS